MASRPTWKGFIRFSLVSIPVKAYTAAASSSGKITLNQLHKGCGSRVKYQKVCPVHGELKADEIASGYEFADEQYVIIDTDELAKLRSKNDRTLGIEAFIPEGQIDPRFYSGRTMYLTPDGAIGGRPYVMLQRLMTEEKRVAFCTGVFNNRDQIMLLRPEQKIIAATFLNYESEVKPLGEFEPEVPAIDIDKKELELGRTLVNQLAEDSFDFSKYTDQYAEELQKLVEAKVQGKEIVAVPAEEEPQVINLMEALQKSLDQAKAKAKPPKVVAPSTAEKRGAATTRKRKTS